MTTPTDTERLLVRPRKVRRVVVVAAVILIGVFTVVAVLLRRTSTGVYFHTSDQVAMVGVGVMLACGALLLARPRVLADRNGVEVRNVLSTQHFPWSQVLGVTFPEGAPWARLELPDDEYVAVMAIQASDGQQAVRAIRALRHLHEDAART